MIAVGSANASTNIFIFIFNETFPFVSVYNYLFMFTLNVPVWVDLFTACDCVFGCVNIQFDQMNDFFAVNGSRRLMFYYQEPTVCNTIDNNYNYNNYIGTSVVAVNNGVC